MKKVKLLSILILSSLLFLFSCSHEEERDLTMKKTQIIEIASVENPHNILRTLDQQTEIESFSKSLKEHKWNTATIPPYIEEENIYTLYQEETRQLLDTPSAKQELKPITKIITYKEEPYITLQAHNLILHFEVPKDVAEYLAQIED